jgi:hypothetical protein
MPGPLLPRNPGHAKTPKERAPTAPPRYLHLCKLVLEVFNQGVGWQRVRFPSFERLWVVLWVAVLPVSSNICQVAYKGSWLSEAEQDDHL